MARKPSYKKSTTVKSIQYQTQVRVATLWANSTNFKKAPTALGPSIVPKENDIHLEESYSAWDYNLM